MEESLMKRADEPVWYENDQLIQEFLESFRKPGVLETEHQAQERSWVKIIEKSILI